MGANLVTLQEYKTYAGINSTNQDSMLNSLIERTSQYVKTHCRRSFIDYVDEAKIEFFNGGVRHFLLAETPVIRVASVQYSTDYGQTYTPLTKHTDWVVSEDRVYSLARLGFPESINGYKVSYFAGYETTPPDLKQAVLDLVRFYARSDTAIHSSRPVAANTKQTEYIVETTLPGHIKRVLDLYVADYT